MKIKSDMIEQPALLEIKLQIPQEEFTKLMQAFYECRWGGVSEESREFMVELENSITCGVPKEWSLTAWRDNDLKRNKKKISNYTPVKRETSE